MDLGQFFNKLIKNFEIPLPYKLKFAGEDTSNSTGRGFSCDGPPPPIKSLSEVKEPFYL